MATFDRPTDTEPLLLQHPASILSLPRGPGRHHLPALSLLSLLHSLPASTTKVAPSDPLLFVRARFSLPGS